MSDSNLTPMMQQYRRLKARHPDALLMFRLGDFYELFGEDAATAAKALDITLTARHGGGEKMPMCGVPHHSADGYVARLLKQGFKVAIAEQMEDPSEARGIVERDVIRVITPGTALNPDILEADRNNFILSVFGDEERMGLAVMDVSTAEFRACEFERDHRLARVFREIERFSPSEALLDPRILDEALAADFDRRFPHLKLTRMECLFGVDYHRRRLCERFGVSTLLGFGVDHLTAGLTAAGMLLDYVRDNLKTDPAHIGGLSLHNPGQTMYLDSATRRNLELTRTLREGEKKGSLLWALDRTRTAMGKRLIRRWVEEPLLDAAAIGERLDAVQELRDDPAACDDLTDAFAGIEDLERLAGRAATAMATPRELSALGESLEKLPEIKERLGALSAPLFQRMDREFNVLGDLRRLLRDALVEDAPRSAREGGLIREGYNREADELREIRGGGRKWIVELEEREREATGIKSLKVGYNKAFGYYIEVTKANLKAVPDRYHRKQTLTGGERFITPELKEKEASILGAEDRLNRLEYELFRGVRDAVAAQTARLLATSREIASLDALVSFAAAAREGGYCRPQVDGGDAVEIVRGRHPVVEKLLPSGAFIANDAALDANKDQIQIITGPNMSGKSTYMRQVALIQLMAQMGSFVPAESARLGVADRIFTRVGAVDDLALGLSTFMVEMVEASLILNNATRKSLVLLDEVGRGTSTADGVGIAAAVIEHLHDRIGAKTLFATHFNELTRLELRFARVVNYHVSAYEKGDEMVFGRQVRRGATDKSFGVEVARLAGLPAAVVRRAREIIAEQETRAVRVPPKPSAQMDMMSDAPPRDPVLEALAGVDPDAMTPKQALEALYRLKGLCGENK